MINPVSQSLMI